MKYVLYLVLHGRSVLHIDTAQCFGRQLSPCGWMRQLHSCSTRPSDWRPSQWLKSNLEFPQISNWKQNTGFVRMISQCPWWSFISPARATVRDCFEFSSKVCFIPHIYLFFSIMNLLYSSDVFLHLLHISLLILPEVPSYLHCSHLCMQVTVAASEDAWQYESPDHKRGHNHLLYIRVRNIIFPLISFFGSLSLLSRLAQ